MSQLVSNPLAIGIAERIHKLPQGTAIAVDCETTGLHPYQGDKLRGFSFAYRLPSGETQSFYVPVGYPEGNLTGLNVKLICEALHSVDPVWIYHHAKFDLRFLRQLPRSGNGGQFFPVPRPGRLWDTKVVAWLMDENMSTSLDAQALLHLGEPKSEYMKELVKERGGWDKLTAADTAEYGAKDAELTLRLYEVQWGMLIENHPSIHGNPIGAIEREMRVQGMLLRIEDNGILVDSGWLVELHEMAEKECSEIEAEFLGNYGVNINSTKQLAELLYDTLGMEVPAKTPGGKRSTSRAALEQLAGGEHHDMINRLLRQRRLRKAISGYLVPLQGLVADDDRLHPTFWSMGTVTGRFSCSDPNLQTIPRADTLEGVRSVFRAEEGMELWEYDLAAAELRVMAGMAGEENLIRQLETGADMHSENAKAIFGEGFTGLQRRAAKNIMYGWSYGLTKRETASKYITGPDVTFAEAMKISDQVLNGIKQLYPKIFRLMQRSTREADKAGHILLGDRWPGRYRRFVTESQRQPRTYTALNARVQGGIGEFMKDVMLDVEEKLAHQGARICLQVHDSLVIEVPEGMGEEVQRTLQRAADDLNPFKMRMIFDGKPWEDHD